MRTLDLQQTWWECSITEKVIISLGMRRTWLLQLWRSWKLRLKVYTYYIHRDTEGWERPLYTFIKAGERMHRYKLQAASPGSVDPRKVFLWLTSYWEAVGPHRTGRQCATHPSSKIGSWGDTWAPRRLPRRGEPCGPAAACPPPPAEVCKAGRVFSQPVDASKCWGSWGINVKPSHK